MSESREERNFDLEADQRQRRLFLALVVGCAVLAILGGVLLALWWIRPPDEGKPPPMPTKEAPEVPIKGFEPFERVEPPPEEPKPQALKKALDDNDVSRGLSRIQGALDKCAAKHGAIDGTKVTVDFSVGGTGRVTESYARSPHTNNPLGLCVADVIKNLGKFKRSETGLRDIRRTIKLRRE